MLVLLWYPDKIILISTKIIRLKYLAWTIYYGIFWCVIIFKGWIYLKGNLYDTCNSVVTMFQVQYIENRMTSNNVAKGLKWIENNAQMAISLSSTVFTVVSSDSDEGSDDADESSSDMFSVEVPLLKNGSTLRSKAAKNVNNNSIIVSNTCAFDTVSSILMTAYRDSAEYRNNVDNCYDSKLLQFSKVLANVGITDKTYSMRAKFLVRFLQHLFLFCSFT